MFFFRKPKVEIIAYISDINRDIYAESPIYPARSLYPQWWKSVQSSKFNWDKFILENTTKGCPGIINTLSSGFILPLWCDIALKYCTEGHTYKMSNNVGSVDRHNNEQAQGFYEDYDIFKIASPWLLKSPVRVQYSMPFYHFSEPPPFVTPPGIVTPVNGFSPTNIFVFLKKEKNPTGVKFIKGTPMLNILPITEKEVVFKNAVVSVNEFTKLKNKMGLGSHFTLNGLRVIHKTRNNNGN